MTVKDFLHAYEFTGRGEYKSDYEENNETQRIIVSANGEYEYFDLLAADYYDVIFQEEFSDIFNSSFCWSVYDNIMYINICHADYEDDSGLIAFQVDYVVSYADFGSSENSTVVKAANKRDAILFALTNFFHDTKECDDTTKCHIDYNENKMVSYCGDIVDKTIIITSAHR